MKVAHGKTEKKRDAPGKQALRVGLFPFGDLLNEAVLCHSERMADTQIDTGRAGVGHPGRAADQANACAILVADMRHAEQLLKLSAQ